MMLNNPFAQGPGAAPFLRNVQVFNPAAFVEDLEAHEARMSAPVATDFEPSLYADNVYREDRVDLPPSR